MNIETLEKYLQETIDQNIVVESLIPMQDASSKAGRFSDVYRTLVRDASGQECHLVLRRMIVEGYGLEHPADRARHLLWCYRAYTDLPKHPNAIDVGVCRSNGSWMSLADAEDYFLIEEFVEGTGYYIDLERILSTGKFTEQDVSRTKALAIYLSELHLKKIDDPVRYTRAMREVIGGGEGIMGLIDGFPLDFKKKYSEILLKIQTGCLERVWHLSQLSGRLCRTHGDFHPWNILFREGTDFSVIDRSRSAWNDPAVDVGSMLMNYLFLVLREGDFEAGAGMKLMTLFLDTYLAHSNDTAILLTLPPQLAMRSMAIVSPVFYPDIKESMRLAFFKIALNILDQPRFNINQLFADYQWETV